MARANAESSLLLLRRRRRLPFLLDEAAEVRRPRHRLSAGDFDVRLRHDRLLKRIDD
jgi:hypothetical protein